MSQPTSRQELYDRIRESSKDEVILEEMIRLGFWPEQDEMPEDPADEIRRRGELERELNALRTEQSRLHNVEAMKQEALKRRLKESRDKRLENKRRKEKEKRTRALEWAQRKERDIVFLGEGVSSGLEDRTGDEERLRRQNLPVLNHARVIAEAMDITVAELRFLAFHRRVSQTSHYQRFKVPKKTGGERLISAPMPRLKAAQKWILDHIVGKIEVHDAAHGFVPTRSIVSNASVHVGRDVVVNVDLKDFFPSIGYKRVKGLFRALGYSNAARTILALLCTEPEIETIELDGTKYHVMVNGTDGPQRRLPQGAPTSPAITNLICRRLDRRLHGTATKLGFTYTRYADDLSFSGAADADVGKLLRRVRWIARQEGFEAHPDKTRIFRAGRRQEVTGIVVNEEPTLAKGTLRRFRALLFQIEKDGPEGKHWNGNQDVLAAAYGFASYVAMVNPAKGAPLKAQVTALLDKHGRKPPAPPPPKPKAEATPGRKSQAEASVLAELEAQTTKPKKPWWKFW